MTSPRRRIRILAALLLLLLAAQFRPVFAYNSLGPVTSGADDVTPDGSCTLREALDAAFGSPDNGDCGAGSNSAADYITFSGVTDVTLVSGHTRLPDINDNNPGGLDVLVDGNLGGGSVVTIHALNYIFQVVGSASFQLDNIKLTNSVVAALQTDAASDTTLDNVTFDSNGTSATGGGAIDNAGTMVINGGSFTNNTAESNTSAFGGAINNHGTLTLNGVSFSNNIAAHYGGAIYSSGTLNIPSHNPATSFTNNHTDTDQDEFAGGGAIYADNNSTTTIDGVTFSNNTSSYGRGAAIYFSNFSGNGTTSVTNSTFDSNQNSGMGGNAIGATNGDGGAVWVQGPVSISHSYFHNNTSLTASGGAIAVYSQGNLTMDNTTLDGNTASTNGSGSGLWVSNGASATLTNVTVAGNTDSAGSQVSNNSGTITFQNTLVANPASGGNCGGTITDGNGNLSYPDTSCPGINGDPKLTAGTGGYALGAGSAATDIGDESFCSSVANDQIGGVRSQDGNGDGTATCDAGAQEGGTNTLPTANDDPNYTTSAATQLNVDAANGVLANDTDAETPNSLTAVLNVDVTGGTLALNPDGSFTYTPNAGTTQDTFTYHANDGAGDSNVATVTITVGNGAPTATDDDLGTISTFPYIFNASVLLSNDSDPENDPLTVSLDSATTANGGSITQIAGVLTYVPITNGTDTFTYHANDGTQDSNNSATVTMNVTGVTNTPPTITPISDQVIPVNSNTGALGFIVGDAETPLSLNISVSSDNQLFVPDANIVIGGSNPSYTVTVTPVTNMTGTANITVTVTDAGLLSNSAVFSVTVDNSAPSFTATVSDQVIAENTATTALAFTVDDAETPGSLIVSGSSNNQALVPDANIVIANVINNDYTVTVTPAANQTGTALITITVQDGGGLVQTNIFQLTVNAPGNTAPTITPISDQTIAENGATNALAFTIGDAETPNSLTLGGASDNQALVPDANIVIANVINNDFTVTVTPAANQYGTAHITITVTDASNATATAQFVLTVDAPPTISDVTDQVITANTDTGALGFTIGDPDTSVGSLTVTGTSSDHTVALDANVVINGTGASRTVTVTPIANATGTSTITITVDDGLQTASDTFLLTVNSAPANTPPTISAISDQSIATNANTGAVAFTINDAETALGSLILSGSSDNTTLVPNVNIVFGGSAGSRTVTVFPAVNKAGTAHITVTVTDGGALTAQSTFTMTVTNTPPSISDVPDQVLNVNTNTGALSFTIGDTETPANVLIMSGSSNNLTLVPNANIVFGGSGANRTVTITPAANQVGAATITLTVSDGNLTASDTVLVTVNAAGNTPPTISDVTDQVIMVNTNTGALNFSVGDAETPGSLTVTGSSSNQALVPNANVVIAPQGGNNYTVTVTPAANQTGTATITLNVSDGTYNTVDTFLLTVNAPGNTPPTITAISDQSIVQDTSTSALPFTVGDAETPGSLTVAGTSSDQSIVPDVNVVISGSLPSLTVTVTPLTGMTGVVTITVTVTDASSATATSTFNVFINAAGAADSDNDGLSDAQEILLGTDPFNPDTDGDGFTDGAEVAAGSNPLDPSSTPNNIPQPPAPPSWPTPTPVPLLTDYNGQTISDVMVANVPLDIRYGIFGRILARNGAWLVGPQQVGNQGLINLGVIDAVDIFNVQGVDMSEGVEVCFRGTGTMFFMDAATAPRQVFLMATVSQDGMTCGVIFGPGTVVMTRNAPQDSAPSAGSDVQGVTPLTGCMVTTLHISNLRAEPNLGADILTIVPYNVTLTATGSVSGWYRVDDNGTVGWIASHLLSVTDQCVG